MALVTAQVFEHSTIRVGELLRTTDGREQALTAEHHAVLAAFADKTRSRYLTCGRRTVRLGSHVGLLQLRNLGIEILPKADRAEVGGHNRWHRALVRMLRVVGDLGLEEHDEADLRLDPGRLFELFVRRYLDECERLVHEGLTKGYRTVEENRTAFRGRLRVAEHIRRNAVNAARFYVASPIFDHRNLPNLALHEALRVVETLPLSSFARARARGLRHAFPELPKWRPDPEALDRFRFTRNTTRYRQALRLARLILFHLAPDVRQGDTPLLALLFDMNALWERYVAVLAKRLRLPGIEVRTQDPRAFWRLDGRTRPLRPDITLRDRETGDVVLVVDTKWKVPSGGQPSSADLKQMFCYHELYGCARSLLLYPAPSGATRREGPGAFVGRDYRCAVGFAAIDGNPQADLRWLLAESGI
ncbi:MAG: hypothetical protein KC619_24265 [Myxococcales bacterium]|nr:hypothetical protein [Myxococcales bacterium]